MPDYGKFKILVDVPSRAPGLGFAETAGGLSSLIHESEPRFAIAIYGPWGSGKTTLMDAIRSELDPDRTVAVEFSAWRYEREEHLIVPLLDTIRGALVAWATRDEGGPQDGTPATGPGVLPRSREAAKTTAKTIGAVMASVLAGVSFKVGIPGALDLTYDANKALAAAQRHGKAARDDAEARQQSAEDKQPGHTFAKRLDDPDLPQSIYHAAFSALSATFTAFAEQSGGVRFVVFVDDLDRCLPTGTLDVLESMKLFFDLEGFVFVVGLDRDVVERSIDLKYTAAEAFEGADASAAGGARAPLVRGEQYLKKIFQVPFSLAPVSVGLIEELFDSMRQDSDLDADQSIDLDQVVRPHLVYLFASMRLNPREVKRYINAYIIQMKIKPDLNPHVVLALNTLAFRPDCERIYTAIATYRVEFTDALRRFLQNEEIDLEDFDIRPGDIPQDIRDYLRAGEGRQLLMSGVLDPHLDAGEATRSSEGVFMLEALQYFREFRNVVIKSLDDFDRDQISQHLERANYFLYQIADTLPALESSERLSEIQMIENWLRGYDQSSALRGYLEALPKSGTLGITRRLMGISPEQSRSELSAAREDARDEIKTKTKLVLDIIRRARRRAKLTSS